MSQHDLRDSSVAPESMAVVGTSLLSGFMSGVSLPARTIGRRIRGGAQEKVGIHDGAGAMNKLTERFYGRTSRMISESTAIFIAGQRHGNLETCRRCLSPSPRRCSGLKKRCGQRARCLLNSRRRAVQTSSVGIDPPRPLSQKRSRTRPCGVSILTSAG